MQKTVSEMVKAQRELHLALRDKVTNDQDLQNSLEELKTSDPEAMAIIKQNIANLEKQGEKIQVQIGNPSIIASSLETLKSRLAEYAVGLKETEAKERSYSRALDISMNSDKAAVRTTTNRDFESKKPQLFLTHRTGFNEANVDTFAQTLSKVCLILSFFSLLN